LQLVLGPVRSVALSVSEPLVHYGGEARVVVAARDAFERPRPQAEASVASPVGTLGPLVEGPPGSFSGTWTLPPQGGVERTDVSARVYGPRGTEPARLVVWRREGLLYAGVADLAGLPVPEQPLRVGEVTRMTGADGSVELGPVRPGTLRIQHGVWTGLEATVYVLGPEGPVFPREAPLVPGVVSRSVTLGPPLPVNVRLSVVGARVTYWVEDARGRVLPDRKVFVSLSAGEHGADEVHDGRTTFTVQGASGPVSVSVADVQTGVTALEEVRP
jgi:hypothetical protein